MLSMFNLSVSAIGLGFRASPGLHTEHLTLRMVNDFPGFHRALTYVRGLYKVLAMAARTSAQSPFLLTPCNDSTASRRGARFVYVTMPSTQSYTTFDETFHFSVDSLPSIWHFPHKIRLEMFKYFSINAEIILLWLPFIYLTQFSIRSWCLFTLLLARVIDQRN